MTKSIVDPKTSHQVLPLTKISSSLERNFAYKLSDKKAASNFLKAAALEPLQVDEKQKCSVLVFSLGAYLKSVFPLINEWKGINEEFRIGTLTIKVNKIVPGYDENKKQVDTVVYFLVNGRKVNVTCFNTTTKN